MADITITTPGFEGEPCYKKTSFSYVKNKFQNWAILHLGDWPIEIYNYRRMGNNELANKHAASKTSVYHILANLLIIYKQLLCDVSKCWTDYTCKEEIENWIKHAQCYGLDITCLLKWTGIYLAECKASPKVYGCDTYLCEEEGNVTFALTVDPEAYAIAQAQYLEGSTNGITFEFKARPLPENETESQYYNISSIIPLETFIKDVYNYFLNLYTVDTGFNSLYSLYSSQNSVTLFGNVIIFSIEKSKLQYANGALCDVAFVANTNEIRNLTESITVYNVAKIACINPLSSSFTTEDLESEVETKTETLLKNIGETADEQGNTIISQVQNLN